MTDTILRLAVVSDLHVYDSQPEGSASPSHLRVGDPENQPKSNPIAGLHELIKAEQLGADVLICTGDLGHQAQPAAIQYSWNILQKLRAELKSRFLAATSGNHDLDSRYKYNSFDAKGMLQSLLPVYPLHDELLNDRYWSRNFAIVDDDNFRLVVLNSSAYHGTAPEEILHGRVSDATLSDLHDMLAKGVSRAVNILICHHHPQAHMEVQLQEYDVMKNGQLLLDLLGSGKHGSWLVIHGHKHHPKITYASGGSVSPIILSAGSLCGNLYKELQTVARNQFHLVDLPLIKIEQYGTLVGTVRSWDWASGAGWADPGPSSGLPKVCGFGVRHPPKLLADQIDASLPGAKMTWRDMVQRIPDLAFLIPRDFDTLREWLSRHHRIHVLETGGVPQEIGRQT